jgi:hypothetical protein
MKFFPPSISARIYRPSFREDKPKNRSFSIKTKVWIYKFGQSHVEFDEKSFCSFLHSPDKIGRAVKHMKDFEMVVHLTPKIYIFLPFAILLLRKLETIKIFLLGFIYSVISFVRALAAYTLSLVMLLLINLGSNAFEKNCKCRKMSAA